MNSLRRAVACIGVVFGCSGGGGAVIDAGTFDAGICQEDLLLSNVDLLKACDPGDSCIRLDEDCICFGAFNEDQINLYRQLVAEGRCEGCPQAFCLGTTNHRCVEGRCTGDGVEPDAAVFDAATLDAGFLDVR